MAASPPDTIRVQTSDNVSLGYTTAGVGSRMVAQIIDNVVAGALMVAALVAWSAIASTASSLQGAVWAVGAGIAFAFFVYLAYFFICEAVSGGRTPGKAAMGLRVLRVDGSAADITSLLVRDVVRILDLIAGIGIVVMFFHPLSRRLGDLAGGTVVVRDRTALSLAAVSAPPPLILRTPDPGPPIDGIERLGSTEHDALRVFLSRPGLRPELRAQLARDVAARLCERLQLPLSAPERAWPPELLLERLYLQLEQRTR